MAQPTVISCGLRRCASVNSFQMTCASVLQRLCVIVLLGVAGGGAARAAITATGDVYPNPIVPMDSVYVGRESIGSVLIDGGSTLESSRVTIGDHRQGIGFATVTGPGAMWDFYGGSVGSQGVGRLAVLDGALVDVGYGGLDIGQWIEGNGAVLVDGLGSVLRVDSGLRVGYQGVGLLQIANDAIVDASYNYTEIGTQGRMELDGGLFRSNELYSYGTIAGRGSIQVLSDYSVNYGRIEVGIGERLTIDGGTGQSLENFNVISVTGGEIEFSLRVSNNHQNTPGEILLRGGVVRFLPPLQWESEALQNSARLAALDGVNDLFGAVRQFDGNTIVTNDSTLIFHDPFTLYDGDLVVHSGSTAKLLSDATLYGRLSLTIGAEDAPTPVQTIGQTEIYGDLHVSFAEAYTPQVGDIFPLVSGTQIIGQFHNPELPDLPFGMAWELNQNSSSIQLQVVDCPDGDYNGDGTVDAADYGVWRDTLGSDSYLHADGSGNGLVDDDDYLVWKTNFGATASSSPAAAAGTTALTTVPEPATGVLLLVGIVVLMRTAGIGVTRA